MTDDQSPSAAEAVAAYGPSGIGGWLSFYIIMHMYVGPAFSVLMLVLAWGPLAGYLEAVAATGSWFVWVALGTVIDIAALAWGILAAWRLNTLKPRAVQFVKIYILANVALGTLGVMIGAATGLSNVFDLVSLVLWAAIWYSYFTVSKRVRATYPDAGEPVMTAGV